MKNRICYGFDLFFCHYSLLASFACSMRAFSAQLAACMLADQMADSVMIGWMRWIRWMVSWVGAHMVGTHMVGIWRRSSLFNTETRMNTGISSI